MSQEDQRWNPAEYPPEYGPVMTREDLEKYCRDACERLAEGESIELMIMCHPKDLEAFKKLFAPFLKETT